MSFYEQDRGDVPDYRELSRRRVVAKRDHVCAHCKKAIKAGERYYRTAGIYDGEWFAEKTHTLAGDCLEALHRTQLEG